MPLEDLTGSKYINALNASWPLGTDSPSAGDDHIRGIKNTLKGSFPTITGPVTRALASLNRGSLPIGTRTIFYQSSAPAGWARVTGLTQTYGLRVLATAGATGGSSGGTDDPVVNAKVPSHTHAATGLTTGNDSPNHTHLIPAGATEASGEHAHQSTFSQTPVVTGTANYVYSAGASYGVATNSVGEHSHIIPAGATSGVSVSHTHAIAGVVAANAGAGTWAPRYMDFILCERTS